MAHGVAVRCAVAAVAAGVKAMVTGSGAAADSDPEPGLRVEGSPRPSPLGVARVAGGLPERRRSSFASLSLGSSSAVDRGIAVPYGQPAGRAPGGM